MKKTKAFTLIELLVVIVIIGILATISVATFNDYQEKARIAKIINFEAQAHKVLLSSAAAQGLPQIVGNWEFDEMNGSSFSDTSPNQNTVTRTGGGAANISTDTPNESTGSFDSAVSQLSNTSAAISLPKDEITMALWLKILTPSSNPAYTIYTYEGGDNDGALLRTINNGMFTINGDSGTNVNITGDGSIDLTDGKWHHMLGSYDGATMKLYIDGELVSSQASVNTLPSQLNRFYIGEVAPAGHRQLLDNVRIYPIGYREN